MIARVINRSFPAIAVPAALAAAAMAPGCAFNDDQGLEPAVSVPNEAELDERETVVTGLVVEALTGEPVDDVVVTLSGPGADRVIDSHGAPVTVVEGSGGFVTFEFQGDGEIDLTVAARAPGYVAGSRRVLLDPGERQTFDVRLVRRETDADGVVTSVPSGVSGQVATGNVAEGALEVIAPQAERPGGARSGGTASLSVPQNTAALDADDNEIPIETAEAAVIYFNNDSEEALEAFPGGFAVQVDQDPDGGSDTDGMFISGGFAAFELTAGDGTPINRFASPITATMEVPAGTINPDTGAEVEQGDSFPIWSYDPQTAAWAFEQNGEVIGVNEDNDNLIVSFETDHLSYWNIDWFRSETCTARVSVRGADARPLRLSAARADAGSGFLYSGWYTGAQTFSVRRAPANIPLVITARLDGQVVGSAATDNFCAHTVNPLAVDVELPDVATGAVRVRVTESCEDGSSARGIPSSSIWYRDASGRWQPARDTNASGESLIEGVRAGPVAIRAEDRRQDSWFPIQSITLAADRTVDVDFSRTMGCQIVTGGFGE
jgi:hypothetical protein